LEYLASTTAVGGSCSRRELSGFRDATSEARYGRLDVFPRSQPRLLFVGDAFRALYPLLGQIGLDL
jgi:hypothetical protein